MSLTARDKKTLAIGGIAAALIVVVGYGILPLVRGGDGVSGGSASTLERADGIRERIRHQKAVLKRRNALAGRLGSLVSFEASEGNTSAQGTPEQGADVDASGDKEDAGKAAAPSPVGLAAYIERSAAGTGVKIGKVTPRKSAKEHKGGKHFVPAMLQLTMEGNIESLLKMLHVLEKGERFVRIEQIQVGRKGNAINATLVVAGYEDAAK